tara:strand:- start:1756 stop:2550 length:795 start_codon:yes stop_codon:yes gene_type:complete
MARSFITGGVSATGLATGKPYVKRIIRKDSTGDVGGGVGPTRSDGLTCKIVTAGDSDGAISFSTLAVDGNIQANDGRGKNWTTDGELLFVEFPATTRTFSVQAEGANEVGAGKFRAKVMLTAPGQKAFSLNSLGAVTTSEVELDPIPADIGGFNQGGNFIEINFTDSEVATVNARTKGVFILIEKYGTDNIFETDGTVQARGGDAVAAAANANDAVSILVTAILDHEGFEGSNGTQCEKIDPDGTVRAINKIHPLNINSTDGVG